MNIKLILIGLILILMLLILFVYVLPKVRKPKQKEKTSARAAKERAKPRRNTRGAENVTPTEPIQPPVDEDDLFASVSVPQPQQQAQAQPMNIGTPQQPVVDKFGIPQVQPKQQEQAQAQIQPMYQQPKVEIPSNLIIPPPGPGQYTASENPEEIAIELLKSLASAISKNSIQGAMAVVSEPIAKTMAHSIYLMIRDRKARSFSINSIKKSEIVSRMPINTEEVYKVRVQANVSDFIIQDATIIGSQDATMDKVFTLAIKHDVLNPSIWAIMNINV